LATLRNQCLLFILTHDIRCTDLWNLDLFADMKLTRAASNISTDLRVYCIGYLCTNASAHSSLAYFFICSLTTTAGWDTVYLQLWAHSQVQWASPCLVELAASPVPWSSDTTALQLQTIKCQLMRSHVLMAENILGCDTVYCGRWLQCLRSSRFLQNVGTYLPDNMASHRLRP
jgi:hypothetical protein